MEKDEANKLLKFGNRLLKGEICIQEPKKRIADAITIRKWLSDTGMWWQSDNLSRSIAREMKKLK